jgi:HPt (histidine-containing phosphotransfer) domain-containing protein
LRKLEIAAGRSDTDALQREAQLLGVAADQLSSPNVGACARRIEQAAARGDFEQLRQNLEALRREFHSLEALAT